MRKSPLPESGASELARRLTRPLMRFDLSGEVETLRQAGAWRRTGHNAKALAKHPDLRVALTVLKAGARIEGHKTRARIAIQTLEGRIRLHAPQRTMELAAGHLLVLDKDIPHDVEALEDSAFLLTLAWPEERARP